MRGLGGWFDLARCGASVLDERTVGNGRWCMVRGLGGVETRPNMSVRWRGQASASCRLLLLGRLVERGWEEEEEEGESKGLQYKFGSHSFFTPTLGLPTHSPSTHTPCYRLGNLGISPCYRLLPYPSPLLFPPFSLKLSPTVSSPLHAMQQAIHCRRAVGL